MPRKGKDCLAPIQLQLANKDSNQISAEEDRSSEIPGAGTKPWNTADVHSNAGTGTQALLPVMLTLDHWRCSGISNNNQRVFSLPFKGLQSQSANRQLDLAV